MKGNLQQISLLICLVVVITAGCARVGKTQTGSKQPVKVVVIGNSIVRHGPNEALGWKGDWGMAASAEEFDFVHQLASKIRSINPQAKVEGFNLADFERNYTNFEASKLDPLRDADILIFKLSENVDPALIVKQDFKGHYLRILDSVSAGKQARIILADGFWPSPVNDVVRQIAQEKNYPFVQLHDLFQDSTMTAKGLFEHQGVANHPSDKGMAAISDRIWEKVKGDFRVGR
jgi:hypothetical protein